MWDKYSVTTSS